MILSLCSASNALAAQTDMTISMDAPASTPHVNGARILGWLPNTPFLYRIPATGSAPLAFEATGLPDGLDLDQATGILTGTSPEQGSFDVHVTVSNDSGEAHANIKLVVGDTLALTPPMGWNSYDSFYENVTEQQVLSAAQAMAEILQPYGWNTVVIDYLWYDPEKIVDEWGRWLPSTSKYPTSNGATGFTPLAQQVHELGLSFGIHLMRGVPRKSFDQNTPINDSNFSAQDAGNSGDVCAWDDHMYGVRGDTAAGQAWYDSIYGQYASWGVDFVKVDDMMNPYTNGNPTHSSEVIAVHRALEKSGRSIVFSLSPGPHQTRDVEVLNANANMWRTVNDFWDTNGLSTIDDEFDTAYEWSTVDGITPGHWPDADMLPLGTIGNRPCAFSHNEQVTVMTLWSMMPSPLMFGGMPVKLDGDDWTVALLTNEEVLAVNQDSLGSRGRRIAQNGSTEVWARDLSGGRTAVALFNRGTEDAEVTVNFADLAVDGTPVVRDLWHKQDVPDATTSITATVPHEAALMYTLTPADYIDPDSQGGSGGSGDGSGGGMDGSGASPGSGGGSFGSGSTTSSGGSLNPGDGTTTGGAPSTGGVSASGGIGAAAGGAPAGDDPNQLTNADQAGCSCDLASPQGQPHLWSFGLLLGLAAMRRRRHLKRG